MSITVQEVQKIASLARLELTPEEEKIQAKTLSQVLDYMKILVEVDTERVEPTIQVNGLADVFRNDEAIISDKKSDLIKQMPSVYAGSLQVPGVFE